MQMDWTTFILEVINFLVLVWLLQHFFYRPVLAVLDTRQAKVQATKSEAETLRRDAEALRAQYESRLADWAAERAQARRQLEQELAQERARQIGELRRALADEEAKDRARGAAAAIAREATVGRQATAKAYGAAAAMLRRLASPTLTARIVQTFCEDLDALMEADTATLRQAVTALTEQEMTEVSSAHPLDAGQRALVADALSRAAERRLGVRFVEAPELIAGLRAAVGQCRLDASLADELAFFQRQHA